MSGIVEFLLFSLRCFLVFDFGARDRGATVLLLRSCTGTGQCLAAVSSRKRGELSRVMGKRQL